MKRLVTAAILIAFALPAAAADLRGQWNVVVPTQPGYLANVLIDADRRVSYDAPLDSGRPASFIGYIGMESPTAVEMVMTNREIVNRILCTKQSSDLMQCLILFKDNRKSDTFTLTRVGPGPAKLLEHPRPR